MLDRVRVRERCLAVVAILLVSASANAATRTAASCASSAVQTAIDSAVSSDTVLVPSGSCTWTSTVSVPNGKNITLQGAGIDSTTISGPAGTVVFQVGASSTRITAFTFACGMIQIDGEGWRIDHNRFTCGTWTTAVFIRGNRLTDSPTGLIDHNTFLNMRTTVYGYPAVTLAEQNGSTQWTEPLGLGTVEAVYVEDNTFTFTTGINTQDCQYSGRYVFRHNDVTDAYAEAHSIYPEFVRACRKWEIYENTFHAVTKTDQLVAFLRGGTGVVFNNRWSDDGAGSWLSTSLWIDNHRTLTSGGPTWALCDGSKAIDGNADFSGWPCRDQLGRGGDTSVMTSSNPNPAQTSEPAYFWGNTCDTGGGAVTCGLTVANGSGTNHIKANRDYFVNVGAKPGYTPFTYPHPLQGGGVPSAPENLRILSSP